MSCILCSSSADTHFVQPHCEILCGECYSNYKLKKMTTFESKRLLRRRSFFRFDRSVPKLVRGFRKSSFSNPRFVDPPPGPSTARSLTPSTRQPRSIESPDILRGGCQYMDFDQIPNLVQEFPAEPFRIRIHETDLEMPILATINQCYQKGACTSRHILMSSEKRTTHMKGGKPWTPKVSDSRNFFSATSTNRRERHMIN